MEELFKNEKTKDEETDSTDTNSTNETSSENTSTNTNTNTTSSSSSNTSTNSKSESKTKEKSKIKVEILNGSGDSTLLTKAKDALKKEGYNVYKTGKTSTTQVTTIINKAKLSEDDILSIKSTLGTGVVSSSSVTSKVDVTIIIGKDYKK